MLQVPNGIVNAQFKGKRILITQPELKEVKTNKGIILPGQSINPNSNQKTYESFVTSEVIAIGDTVNEVAVGDTILYHLADVQGMGVETTEGDYIVLTPGAVIAVVDSKHPKQASIDFSKSVN
jgi:co-chaperonin GroES (HSP10)